MYLSVPEHPVCVKNHFVFVFAQGNGMFPWFTDNDTIFSHFPLWPVEICFSWEIGGDFTADEKASVSLPNFNIRNPEFAKKKKKKERKKEKQQ